MKNQKLKPKKKSLKPQLSQETEEILRATGTKLIVGVDEAGRGAWAGPVVASAVILPTKVGDFGINDSKALTPEQRDAAYELIMKHAEYVGVGVVECAVIDKLGLAAATYMAMRKAVDDLKVTPGFILVDGYKVTFPQAPSSGMLHGDARCLSIAAASIIAKVTRDRLMIEWHGKYPRFGFAIHKGYGTQLHKDRLAKHGLSPIHRRSFAPIALMSGRKIIQPALE